MPSELAYHGQALDDDLELQARLVRKTLKTPFEGSATYWQGDYIEGTALARNLGHGDVLLRLNRCLAPGDPIRLELLCLPYRGLPIQMDGQVIECTPAPDTPGFVAVVHVHRNPR